MTTARTYFEWVGIILIKIQFNKCGPTMHGWLLMDIHVFVLIAIDTINIALPAPK